MLTDWTYWLSCRHPEQVLALLWALLLTDVPRYALSKIVICFWDSGRAVWNWLVGNPIVESFSHCPSVCVVIAGYNEAKTVAATLHSLWGAYPRLEIIVVNDGSKDGMADVARRFARGKAGVLVLSRPERGGKSSALNFALPYTTADVILSVDADSHLDENAIWEIVQPFRDAAVGLVAATVLARNGFTNLTTWMQAYEYLHTIFMGRLVAARLNILGVSSGALTAIRREALLRCQGWDVAPGEDLDLTLRIRKAGYRIAFAPYAQCFTNVPTTWWRLFKQRLRWERSGSIRHHCRKHLDMAHLWSANFRWSDFFVLVESWLCNVVFLYAIWGWIAWFCWKQPADGEKILVTLYLCYLMFEVVQVLTVALYSTDLRRDVMVCLVFPLMPFYQLFLLLVRLIATTDELFLRRSFDDDFSPARVREATWRW